LTVLISAVITYMYIAVTCRPFLPPQSALPLTASSSARPGPRPPHSSVPDHGCPPSCSKPMLFVSTVWHNTRIAIRCLCVCTARLGTRMLHSASDRLLSIYQTSCVLCSLWAIDVYTSFIRYFHKNLCSRARPPASTPRDWL